MRSLLLLSLLASPLLAAQPPDDFAGIKWGASINDATKALGERGAKFDRKEKKSDPGTERYVFTGGSLAGREVREWTLVFRGNAFAAGGAVIKTDGRGEPEFRKLKSDLSNLYGLPADKQVARRKPGRFVLGLGWLVGGSVNAPLKASWSIESALTRRAVQINTWSDKHGVHVVYTLDDGDDAKATPSPGAVKKDL